MKTLYKLAQELGVNYATVYKRFKNSELINSAGKNETGKLLVNDEIERVVRQWYIKPTSTKVDVPDIKVDVLTSTENIEIQELKNKNKELENRVRELTDELITLNKQVVELTKSAHILLGMEQQNKTKLIESSAKKGFWNIFRKKKQD